MALIYGMRKVKVFKDVPANTLTQVDELFGTGSYGYIQVFNNSGNDATITLNTNPSVGQTGAQIPVPFSDTALDIPMVVTNFIATDVVTVIAYGN